MENKIKIIVNQGFDLHIKSGIDYMYLVVLSASGMIVYHKESDSLDELMCEAGQVVKDHILSMRERF